MAEVGVVQDPTGGATEAERPVTQFEERRAHPRVEVSCTVRCTRIGPRPTPGEEVRVVDLSLGGVRVVAPRWMDLGNVVEIATEDVTLRGLVVGVSRPGTGDPRHGHVAFGDISARARRVVSDLVELHAALP